MYVQYIFPSPHVGSFACCEELYQTKLKNQKLIAQSPLSIPRHPHPIDAITGSWWFAMLKKAPWPPMAICPLSLVHTTECHAWNLHRFNIPFKTKVVTKAACEQEFLSFHLFTDAAVKEMQCATATCKLGNYS